MSETKYKIPVIPLRGLTIIPGTTVHFDISRKTSITVAEDAMIKGQEIFVVTQKNPVDDAPGFDDIYKIGTVVKVKQINKKTSDVERVIVKGISKAEILSMDRKEDSIVGEIEIIPSNEAISKIEEEAYLRELRSLVTDNIKVKDDEGINDLSNLMAIANLSELMLQFLMKINLNYKQKQEILEANSLEKQYELLVGFLKRENEIESVQKEIANKVMDILNKNQREHILREQMNVIMDELGDSYENELEELNKKIENLNASGVVKEKLFKELSRYKNFGNMGVEGNLIRNYIDTMLNMPWNNETKENPDLKNAKAILDRDHYGLEKVKDRMLEFLAVRTLTKAEGNSPIICLVGPPGTGKTSIAHSVAEALNKKYIRICLGGVDDESEIRGHRRTYVGAMSGRIAQGLAQAKANNPLILFDEIDKLGHGVQGDPSAALLEVMDSEQNSSFRDNYIEVPLDLSKVLFIATANDMNAIPDALYDRMEIINLEGYTENEKFHIAKEHLIKKECKKNGIKKSNLTITDSAIKSIIKYYSREAGVRELNRKIGEICRKAARLIVEDNKKMVRVTSKNMDKFLGRKKFDVDLANEKDDVGIVRGLAWTAVGGTTLQIEVNTMPGKGELKLTGQLGDVMKESASIALSYVRSISSKYNVAKDFYMDNDFHVHIPEGAVPKDGPSAGVTMATALLSAVTDKKVNCKVAMTGEINLRGKVLPIGGLKEKLLAAKNAGIKKVLVPVKNETEVNEVSSEITDGLDIVYVSKMQEVIENAFV